MGDVTTTTTTTVPDPLDAFMPDPWEAVSGIGRWVFRFVAANWLFVAVCLVLLLLWMAWRSFKQTVWGH